VEIISPNYPIAWSPDEKTIVTGSVNGLVTIWDAATAQSLKQFLANPSANTDALAVDDLSLAWVRDVAFSPDGRTVQAISGDGTVREWDAATGELLRERQLPPLATASWSPYGARLVIVDLTLKDGRTLTDPAAFDADQLAGNISFVVPFADQARLQQLADACELSSDLLDAVSTNIASERLTEIIAQVNGLDETRANPACAADLLAVAQALLVEGE
jgi:hypothetical protein